jgi:hypothetical protein
VALGLIPKQPGNNVGFYAGIGTGGPGGLRTWFANDISGTPTQGYLNSTGSNPYHCAPDFYTKTKTSPSPPPISSLALAISQCLPDAAGRHRCQYTWNGGSDLTGGTFLSHYQITIYVPTGSDITIDSNITYQEPFNPNDAADVPYFALITQGGDINLKNAVTQLDGLYVAQPTIDNAGNVAGGSFATCDPGSQCNNQLVVNGAVIAQQVKPLRAHGAIEGGVPNSIGNAPAEIFNFVPSMVLGIPAFDTKDPTQGLYSIAPVF